MPRVSPSGDDLLVVTGIPRSGTSMVMSLLEAGGVPLFVDGARPPDAGNPRGYFEHSAVMRTRTDASWVPAARGRAVKVVAPLPCALPAGFTYRVIVIERDPRDVLASQRRMLAHGGRAADAGDDAALAAALAGALARTREWIASQPRPAALELRYERVLADPAAAAAQLVAFARDSQRGDAPAVLREKRAACIPVRRSPPHFAPRALEDA